MELGADLLEDIPKLSKRTFRNLMVAARGRRCCRGGRPYSSRAEWLRGAPGEESG
jgi:hypothetical protein